MAVATRSGAGYNHFMPFPGRKQCGVRRFPRQGFTLIELLITVVIMIIMFTMLWGFSSRRNQLSKRQKCQANLQKIFISSQIYANDFAGWFPLNTNATTSEAALAALVPKYCVDPRIFICPGSKDTLPAPGTGLLQTRISYAYYMGRQRNDEALPLLTDRQIDTKAKLQYAQVFSNDGAKPANNHHKYGGVILFADGNSRMSGPDTPIGLPLGPNVILLNPKP